MTQYIIKDEDSLLVTLGHSDAVISVNKSFLIEARLNNSQVIKVGLRLDKTIIFGGPGTNSGNAVTIQPFNEVYIKGDIVVTGDLNVMGDLWQL